MSGERSVRVGALIKDQRKMVNIINEIKTTEGNFRKDMKILCGAFKPYLGEDSPFLPEDKKKLESFLAPYENLQNEISSLQLKAMEEVVSPEGDTVEKIKNFSSSIDTNLGFMSDLRRSDFEKSILNYKDFLEFYSSLEKKNIYKETCRSIAEKLKIEKLKIEKLESNLQPRDYFIKPIQFSLKYPLFIKELESISQQFDDHALAELKELSNKVNSDAKGYNEAKRNKENTDDANQLATFIQDEINKFIEKKLEKDSPIKNLLEEASLSIKKALQYESDPKKLLGMNPVVAMYKEVTHELVLLRKKLLKIQQTDNKALIELLDHITNEIEKNNLFSKGLTYDNRAAIQGLIPMPAPSTIVPAPKLDRSIKAEFKDIIKQQQTPASVKKQIDEKANLASKYYNYALGLNEGRDAKIKLLQIQVEKKKNEIKQAKKNKASKKHIQSLNNQLDDLNQQIRNLNLKETQKAYTSLSKQKEKTNKAIWDAKKKVEKLTKYASSAQMDSEKVTLQDAKKFVLNSLQECKDYYTKEKKENAASGKHCSIIAQAISHIELSENDDLTFFLLANTVRSLQDQNERRNEHVSYGGVFNFKKSDSHISVVIHNILTYLNHNQKAISQNKTQETQPEKSDIDTYHTSKHQ